MKLILGVLSLIALQGAAFAKRCGSPDDCTDDRCCAGLTPSQMLGKGICLLKGAAGARCSPPEAQSEYYGGKFLRYCDCKNGLVCKSKGLKPDDDDPVRLRNSLRCQKPTEEKSTTAADQTDATSITTPESQTQTETETESTTGPSPTPGPGEGPGGERPRDDDCEDWTYGC